MQKFDGNIPDTPPEYEGENIEYISTVQIPLLTGLTI